MSAGQVQNHCKLAIVCFVGVSTCRSPAALRLRRRWCLTGVSSVFSSTALILLFHMFEVLSDSCHQMGDTLQICRETDWGRMLCLLGKGSHLRLTYTYNGSRVTSAAFLGCAAIQEVTRQTSSGLWTPVEARPSLFLGLLLSAWAGACLLTCLPAT